MSDEEYEKFEVSDYDLQTEFNPNRFRRKQSKHQAVYGIWAEDSDDEDSRGRGRGKPKVRTNYSSGVAFISAGLQQPIKKEDENVANDEDGEMVADIPVTDSSSEDEATLIPKAFGKKLEMDLADTAGLRTNIMQGGKSMGMYGIGARLALKMGYQPGKGLGKDLQGISAPIEAVQRKGRGAIGAYGREIKSKPAEVTISDPTRVALKPQKDMELTWRKGEPGSKKRSQTEIRYVTLDDVLEQKSLYVRPDAGFLAKTKVIDLTGPETRILSGYHAISGQKRPADDWESERVETELQAKLLPNQKPAFEMPELIHNINLIVDNCEQDIMKNDRKSKYAIDREVTIKQELERLQKREEMEVKQIESTEDLIDLIQSLTIPGISHEEALKRFRKLIFDFPEDYKLRQMHNMASAVAIPILLSKLKTWNPMKKSKEPMELFLDWRDLLSENISVFHTILWEAWMPSIRHCVLTWNAKEADSMLSLLENWKLMTPNWMFSNILDQMILPKITSAVEVWDPLSDNVPIHAWIHPWLRTLGTKLEIVYPMIRQKLANALIHWHPSDASGKQILTPWIKVFSKGSMDAFIIKNIIPKLQIALQELGLTAQTQVLEPWNWVMDWSDITPVKALVEIFDTTFFPKWLQFLVTWLNQRPNFEEIYRWYTWWRTLFPEVLMRDPAVTGNLKKALEMINATIQSPGTHIDFNYILGRSSPVIIPQTLAPVTITPELMAEAIRLTSQVPNGFRDLVQIKCEQLGLLFMPIPNRYYEGKQVYRCGDIAIYITANVIFIFREGSWVPISLQQLLQIATGQIRVYAS